MTSPVFRETLKRPARLPAPMSLLVVGTVAYDTIETPFGKAEKVLGGSATYFSAAASFYTPTFVVGIVGQDFRIAQLDFLRKRGVDLRGVEIKVGEKTFHWSGRYRYDLNSRDTLATELNALAKFDPRVPVAAKNAPFVFLGNFDPVLQAKVLDQVDAPKFVAMDTMDYWMDSARKALDDVIRRVHCLIVNDEEARQLSGQGNLVKAAATIQKMGPKTVIIKKGEHGALLFNEGKMFFAPAYPLENVVDPTGAGDTFAGGVMGYLASVGKVNDETLRRAIVKGSALASFCVEKFGPERLVNLTKDEVLERARVFGQLTRYEHF